MNFALKRSVARFRKTRGSAISGMAWCARWSVRKFSIPGSGRRPWAGLSFVTEASAAAGIRGRYPGRGRGPGYRRGRKANFFPGRKHGRLLRFHLSSPAAGGIRGRRIRRAFQAPSADIAPGESAGRFSDVAGPEGQPRKSMATWYFRVPLTAVPKSGWGPRRSGRN